MINLRPFTTSAEQAKFAWEFVERRLWGFEKDINICLSHAQDDRAFMPGLMTCMSFLDLLSGMCKGKVEGHSHKDFVDFMREFTPAGRYGPNTLRILYIGFRHKLAHLGHPFFVFDTRSDPHRRLDDVPRMLLTWEISSEAREPPIELIDYPVPQRTKTQPVPWEVYYDHRICISVRTLADDAMEAACAYRSRLETDEVLLAEFVKCMYKFYQQ
jgi:hypothetical protein